MADESPNVTSKPKSWYQGLSRYQWWVLLIASMGWMFDTMDQQFFNLGRGPAMQEVLGYDPISHGLERLGEAAPEEYTKDDLDALVDEGILTSVQMTELLEFGEEQRSKVSRRYVARAVGNNVLEPTYRELGSAQLAEKSIEQEVFTEADVSTLAEQAILTESDFEGLAAAYPDGRVPRPALTVFLGREIAKVQADKAGDDSTFIFVMGWAIGGLFFGWVGDALGRAKTMALTILTYAIFTGLNGLAETELQFNVLRFMTALGVGGEFAAGAALVAESMPDRSRPAALGTLQALSAFGNMMGAALAFFIMPVLGWRWLFAVGALPGAVAVVVFLGLKEPEKWKEARRKWLEERAAGTTDKRASYAGLFQDPRWRKRAIVGLLLGVVGVGGLWGVGFFTPELNRAIAKNYSPEAKEKFVAIAFFLQQVGAFFGISAYTVISLKMGRKPAFAFFFAIAFVVVSYTFLAADTITEAYVLAPLVGFVTLGPFGGFAIYFPELFPTRLRATGTGFCYNVGRFLAALVPSFKARLKEMFMSGWLVLPFLPAAIGDAEKAIRYGSFLMIFIYIFGLFVLFFAPETKGEPLPED